MDIRDACKSIPRAKLEPLLALLKTGDIDQKAIKLMIIQHQDEEVEDISKELFIMDMEAAMNETDKCDAEEVINALGCSLWRPIEENEKVVGI